MTKPGFRKTRSTGTRAGGRESTEGFLSGALFSQAQILHLMKNEFARSRRHGLPLGCIVLQVDRLPQLVDLYGAELRHAVRTAMAQLVRDKTRGSDLLGTTNDDRYLLLLPHTDLAGTRLVADRLLAAFAGLEVAIDGKPLALCVSVGVSSVVDHKAMFFDTLLAQAESALEDASRAGGSIVRSFGESRLRDASDGPDARRPETGGGQA
ncbi:MAG: GGDEF domain-containing protein [Planctomycetes bacterium]|nr:GGDEF domain-containing protein [Planctomycetota bacterium]